MAVSKGARIKTISLHKLFLQYLAVFSLTTILLAGVTLLCVEAGFRSGFVLPANYAERAVKEARDGIARSDAFDRTLIPFPCTYILFDFDGTVIESDMTPGEIERAVERIRKQLNHTGGNAAYQYAIIERSDSVCVVC